MNKITSIDISVTILNGSFSLKVTILELTNVLLLSQSVDSMTMLMVILEITLVNSTVCLCQYSLSMLLSILEFSLVL